jgi:Nodulation protein Z (NodZ)
MLPSRIRFLFRVVVVLSGTFVILSQLKFFSESHDNNHNGGIRPMDDEPWFVEPSASALQRSIETDTAESAAVAMGKHRLSAMNANGTATATAQEGTATLPRRKMMVPYFSSVDYFACCGAGHRLTKLADAYYLAKRVRFSIRVFFGYCTDQGREVFSHFFGPQPYDEAEEMARSSPPNLVLKVGNEAPGFTRLIREGPNATCRCGDDRLESDVELFRGLRDRFRGRRAVDAFRDGVFANRTVIGVHVRAGNGETGDFVRKNRTIADASKWQESVAALLASMSANWTRTSYPPLLFVATDTPQVIASFKSLLSHTMPVVDVSQNRIDHGRGVLFGEQGNVTTEGRECLDGWGAVFTDMMLLSHADVVVAARPSSFTQSIPMTLALSTEKTRRKVLKSYCEVNPGATEYVCYEDLADWCCNGVTSFSLEGIQRYDYRRMPRIPGIDENDYKHHIKPRPRRPRECIPTPPDGRGECLPYQFPAPADLLEANFVALPGKDMRLKKRQVLDDTASKVHIHETTVRFA